MLYLMAVLLPPVALFGAKKPFQGIFSIVLMLTIIGWIPAAIWALLVVNQSKAEKRNRELIAAQKATVEAQTAALLAAQQSAQVAPILEPAITLPEVPSQN